MSPGGAGRAPEGGRLASGGRAVLSRFTHPRRRDREPPGVERLFDPTCTAVADPGRGFEGAHEEHDAGVDGHEAKDDKDSGIERQVHAVEDARIRGTYAPGAPGAHMAADAGVQASETPSWPTLSVKGHRPRTVRSVS